MKLAHYVTGYWQNRSSKEKALPAYLAVGIHGRTTLQCIREARNLEIATGAVGRIICEQEASAVEYEE